MVNYQNSKIYKIVCDETGLVYYGSTTQKLCERLAQHKRKGNGCKTKEMKNPKIYLIEYFPCNTKEELTKRERWFIENIECCNKKIPTRTPKEYREDNKEKLKEKKKEYNEANKDKIKEKMKVKITCECGSTYRKYDKTQHEKSKKHHKVKKHHKTKKK